MVPASMFMYGSILMAVTLRPVVLRSKPVEEAVTWLEHGLERGRGGSPGAHR